MILESFKYRGFEFEEIDTSKEKYIRIEVGISASPIIENLSNALRSHYYRTGRVKNIRDSFKKISWFRGNVADYMLKSGLNESQIRDFFLYVKDVNENMRLDDKLTDLTEQQLRVIRVYIMSLTSTRIFVETGGMYFSVLKLAYKILKAFIEAGGLCIEVAYPHFDIDDKLGFYISSNPKLIKLGEMKIKVHNNG